MSFPWSKGSTLVATELNQAIVDRVAKAGDTMSGPLILSGAPSTGLQAATKTYVDGAVSGIVFPSSMSRLITNQTPISYPGAVTSEQDLQTYTLPGGTLANDGSYIHIKAYGTVSNLSAVRNCRLYFGATQVAIVQPGSGGPFNWDLEAHVFRTNGTSQQALGKGITNTNNNTGQHTTSQSTPAETLSSPLIIKITGQSTLAGAGAVVSSVLLVEML